MPWFKIDDKMHSHPKIMRAGVPAMGLWAVAGSWCMDFLTDGFVPVSAARRLDPAAEDMATELVAAGLWDDAVRDGEAGWQFRNWQEFQPTRVKVEADREAAKERMRLARESKGSSREHAAKSQRSSGNPVPVPVVSKETTTATAAASADFERFWAIYPKRVGRKAAEKAFTKALKDTDVATIATALRAQVTEWQASRDFPQYVPHPATWLNQGRWADEVAAPETAAQTFRPVAHQMCDNHDPHPGHQYADAHNRYFCHGIQAVTA